jgi:hypothetical protein
MTTNYSNTGELPDVKAVTAQISDGDSFFIFYFLFF